MSDPSPGLRVSGLTFRYPAYEGLALRELLRGLSLDLVPGGITVLLGLPDSGKTTLGRVLAGLVPRFTGGELEGEVRFAEQLLTGRPAFELVQTLGLVFQNPGEQLISSRCDSEVAFALESLGVPRPEMQGRVEQALQRLGLWDFRQRDPQTLSGGEKKKLLLACLLAVDPPVWLLDETLEELDQESQHGLLGLLREQGRTGLVFSAKWHSVFSQYVRQVCLLEDGRVTALDAEGGGVDSRVLVERGFMLSEESLTPGGTAAPEAGRPRGTGELLLEADDLEFSYPGAEAEGGPRFRLRIPQLRVRAGETVALVGDNGSGKSTLARLLAGLLTPQRGTIRIRGAAASPDDLNRFSAYMFQDPDLQIFLPTVAEELAYGLALQGRAPHRIEAQVADAVSRFALPGPQVPAALMSYGARKRLQAAVYYLLDRPLVIIDEGDSGLGVGDFVRLVREFALPETAVLIITHDLRLARVLAGRTIRLERGRVA